MAWEIEEPTTQTKEKIVMSSIVPRRLLRWLDSRLRAVLPLGAQDWLTQFVVQTQLIFSRTILAILGVLVLDFFQVTVGAGDSPIFEEQKVFLLLLAVCCGLAMLTHMNLLGVERESRTAEMLLMRMPSVHRFLRFKLRFSLLWALVLMIPLISAFTWFLELGAIRALQLIVVFAMAMAIPALITGIVSTYIPHGIAALVIAAGVVGVVVQVLTHSPLPGAHYFNAFMSPFEFREMTRGWGLYPKIQFLLLNRVMWALYVYGLYQWLADRVRQTEHWAIQS